MARNRSVATIAAIALAGLVAQLGVACRPMYGSTSLGAESTEELAAVSISPIPGRVGQRIRNDLIFHFTGGGAPLQPRYHLEVSYRESTLGVLIKRTNDASGEVYSIDADFTLKTIDGSAELMKGRSHARAALDKNESTFANTRAEFDAQNRAARDIATDISVKVAAFISSQR
jgi:LPS-assembly lipoprotein